MQNITNKKRFLFLSLAILFTFAVLMLSFAPKSIANADTSFNSLVYDGSPYSTVFTQKVNESDNIFNLNYLNVNGSNFQIENNFTLNSNSFNYHFFSNTSVLTEYNGNNLRFYNTYFVGFDFEESYVDSNLAHISYQVKAYSSSSDIFNMRYYDNGVFITDSRSADMTQFANYDGVYYIVPSQYEDQRNEDDILLNGDSTGYYATFEYGVTYYIIYFTKSYLEGDGGHNYTRCMELYCSKPFNTINNVSVTNSKLSFNLFNDRFFQGIEVGNDAPDSIKFTYYGNNPSEEYLSVNCYSYKEPNALWNGGNYDYSRTWYLSPPELTNNQYYQNGFNVGREQGFQEGMQASQDTYYNNGYNDGLSVGNEQGYEQGMQVATDNAYNRGFDAGKTEGIASANEYSFTGLLGAVVDAPITALTGLLNFEILGFNLANFFYGLVTCCVIIFVIRTILAR